METEKKLNLNTNGVNGKLLPKQTLYELLIAHQVEDKTAKRFVDKVITTENGCWLWQANTGLGGYGRFQWNGKARFAHRWIFEQLYGEAGPSIDHICGQASCVNPAHLQSVTRSQNTKLMHERGPVPRSCEKASGSRLYAVRRAVQEGRLCKIAFDMLRNKGVSEEEAQRFSVKITIDEKDCWVWNGAKNNEGYASFSFLPNSGKKHKSISGHRWAYIKLFADPGKLVLDHLCRNRACCNPVHLEPTTGAENSRRGDHKTRTLAITHCPQGHPYSEENTRLTKLGQRCCRTCERNRANAKKTHCTKGHLYDLENTGYRELSNGKTIRDCKVCASQPKYRVESCLKGHPYDKENTWVGSNGKRACRECARIRANESKTHCAQGHQYTLDTVEIVNGARRCLLCIEAGPRYTKTHCSKGHEFTQKNTGFKPRRGGNPYRYCKDCENPKSREYQRQKRHNKRLKKA